MTDYCLLDTSIEIEEVIKKKTQKQNKNILKKK